MMFEREILLNRFLQGYFHKLFDELSAEQLTQQPSPGVNTPLWLAGHMTIGADYGLRCLGLPGVASAAWHRAFGPGSVVNQHDIVAPSVNELRTQFDAGYAALCTAAATADPVAMQAPQQLPIAFLKVLPAVGDLVAHLLTTHLAVHLGQLSAWRRQVGLPGVLSL